MCVCFSRISIKKNYKILILKKKEERNKEIKNKIIHLVYSWNLFSSGSLYSSKKDFKKKRQKKVCVEISQLNQFLLV